MKKARALTLVSAALVAGLALGSVSIAVAAPATPIDGTTQGVGLRMGEAIHAAGARLIDIDTAIERCPIFIALVAGETVAEGVLDAEDKDAILQNMADRLSERLTSTETGPFGGGRNGAGIGGGYGMGDGICLAGQ
jgi:hypothetical protein